MVFVWHFIDGRVAREGAPAVFFLSVLDEGHTGVALFMTLSGYLFARLLEQRTILWGAFFVNRLLRLMPLLLLIVVVTNVLRFDGLDLEQLALELYEGFVYGLLPNGGWSIVVELHFYVLLPVLLAIGRRRHALLLVVVAAAIGLRGSMLLAHGALRDDAYFTLLGHIDHFVLGLLAWQWRSGVASRMWLVMLVVGAFTLSYWVFDLRGGFYGTTTEPAWVFLPTIEGVAYGTLIAWYGDQRPIVGRLSSFIARQGEYSYSVYLLHFAVVFRASKYIHENIMDISNFYVALGWALICFVAMGAPGAISYTLIERPFLRFRRRYVREASAPRSEAGPGVGQERCGRQARKR